MTFPPLPADVAERITTFTGREWALGCVESWIQDQQGWLTITGPPGVGKTALAARLVEIAMANSAAPAEQSHLRIHAAHFCRQQDSDSLDPIQVVEAIGRQFCASIPGYLEELAHHDDNLHRIISIEQT
jgi:hypothetical protein